MYVRGKYFWYGEDLTDAFAIRKKVFGDEQGMKDEVLFDDMDKVAVHAIVYNDKDEPIASGRIINDEGNYRIGKIAVLPEARGKLYGDFLVRMLVDKGYLAGATTIQVQSQIHAVGFYEKIGFKKSGNVFVDNNDGLTVQPMELPKGSLCKECQNNNVSRETSEN